MIVVSAKGDFKKTISFLKSVSSGDVFKKLDTICQEGVNALKKATPMDTGLTASSWSYEIKREKNKIVINWNNSNVQNGIPIAIILQYGHGTRYGGYVQGRDYINPAICPIFDKITDVAWKEVKML